MSNELMDGLMMDEWAIQSLPRSKERPQMTSQELEDLLTELRSANEDIGSISYRSLAGAIAACEELVVCRNTVQTLMEERTRGQEYHRTLQARVKTTEGIEADLTRQLKVANELIDQLRGNR